MAATTGPDDSTRCLSFPSKCYVLWDERNTVFDAFIRGYSGYRVETRNNSKMNRLGIHYEWLKLGLWFGKAQQANRPHTIKYHQEFSCLAREL